MEAAYLKRLSKYTNLIPIFTKGDYLEADEVPDAKMRLIKLSRDLGVEWFNCKEVRCF